MSCWWTTRPTSAGCSARCSATRDSAWRRRPNGNAALLLVDQADPDVILLDLLMPPGPDGLETLSRLRERGRHTPVIMMSGKAQLTDAVRSVKLGAFQFLEKPLTPEAVLVTVRAALELDRTRAQNRALQAELARREHLIGDSPPMQQVRALIERVGPPRRGCWSPASPVPGRSWSPRRCTRRAAGPTGRSSR